MYGFFNVFVHPTWMEGFASSGVLGERCGETLIQSSTHGNGRARLRQGTEPLSVLLLRVSRAREPRVSYLQLLIS